MGFQCIPFRVRLRIVYLCLRKICLLPRRFLLKFYAAEAVHLQIPSDIQTSEHLATRPWEQLHERHGIRVSSAALEPLHSGASKSASGMATNPNTANFDSSCALLGELPRIVDVRFHSSISTLDGL